MSNLSEEDKKILENQNNGMGIFGFSVVLVISVTAIILLLDAFKHQLVPFFPKLDNFLGYIFETLNNIYIIISAEVAQGSVFAILILIAVVVLIILFFIYIVIARRKKDVIEYNKKHKIKVKTYAELEKIREKEKGRRLLEEEKRELEIFEKEDSERKKREKEEEKKRIQEEKKLAQGEEKAAESEPSGGSLTGKIARLQKLYKNGTLTKAEFEKAKNNLLK